MEDGLKGSKSSAINTEKESTRSDAADTTALKNCEGLSYWKRVLKSYEERNASLEKRRAALAERVHFMECALPSLLTGAAVAAVSKKHRGVD